MDEQTRKRQELCSNLIRETEHFLRVVYQSHTPVRLETKIFSTLENQFWLLPLELSKLLHKIHSMMDEENDLIGRSDNGGVSFRRNDLWASLRTDLSKLEEELNEYEITLKPEVPTPSTDLEVKNSERLLLLRKVVDGLVVLAMGRELHEKYCLEFNETGYDKNYKYYDEQKAAAAVVNSILTDEQLLALFTEYREQLRPYWNFSGKFYTYQGKSHMLTLEGAWPNFEKVLDDLFNKHGRATYAVLKAYIQVKKDNYPWSACDYKQLEYVAKELGGGQWRNALTALEVHGVIQKRESGRRPGERSIALEMIPLVQQVLSRWEKEHPESLSESFRDTTKRGTRVLNRPSMNERPRSFEYDAFICHAGEDKKDVAEPLAKLLMQKGLNVWYDEFTLKVGDSLRQKIDYGLANSRYGIVILSPSFFKKNWPQKELNGLTAREDSEGHKVILPVWHGVERDYVLNYSPTLADRVAAKMTKGIQVVLAELLDAILEPTTPKTRRDTGLKPVDTVRRAALTGLEEEIIGEFYFEIGELTPGIIRVAAFETPAKPNITSNPVDSSRIKILLQLFQNMSQLTEYKVTFETPLPLKAQGSQVLVQGIRANVSKKDMSRVSVDEIKELIKKNLPSIALNPSSALVGAVVSVSGAGFSAVDHSCSLSGDAVTTPACLMQFGKITGHFVVRNVPAGSYVITATGSPQSDHASAILEITG